MELNNGDSALLSVDISNAFNTVSRADVASALYANNHTRPLWRLFDAAYRWRTPLVLLSSASDGTYVLWSEDGVRQGDPAGTFLFSLTLQPLLKRLRARFPSVTIVAIADDISVVADFRTVCEIYDWIKRELRGSTLKLSDH